MRSTVVYILRLLVDEVESGALRGFLRNVSSGEEHVFSSEQSLLELLHTQLDDKLEKMAEDQTDQIRRSDT
jgi:hypothetical protein